jgi:hypothetical protein
MTTAAQTMEHVNLESVTPSSSIFTSTSMSAPLTTSKPLYRAKTLRAFAKNLQSADLFIFSLAALDMTVIAQPPVQQYVPTVGHMIEQKPEWGRMIVNVVFIFIMRQ